MILGPFDASEVPGMLKGWRNGAMAAGAIAV
jgi:hypothetical protein